ncbi:MAG TPA: LuxR C-terminal-related transcriptional regulator [Coxiellaceae bacterium]|nr:MAG: hypothetical protein A3E81_08070 [Gammaproteobacteria bacterium RIFCSPHIGHO2_12_FULL_36_30]HLB57115.1 LuxR C-terminal-related transcriptional regulator [Coxiellaceae bacterium]
MNTDLSKHPIFTEAQAIADICKPLQHLNINHFCLVRMHHDASRTWIATSPEFTKHYLNKKYYEVDVHSVDSQLGEFFLYENMIFRGKTQQLVEDAGEFGLKQFFTITEKNNEAINYYHFSTSSSKNMNYIYLNHYDLLKKFIRFFNNTVCDSKELSAMSNFQLPTGKVHHNCELIVNDASIDVALFEKEINKRMLKTNNNVNLSLQQKNCLHYLSQGYSAKEIALKLNISYRTVESYLSVIRTKLQFRNSKAMIAWYSQILR